MPSPRTDAAGITPDPTPDTDPRGAGLPPVLRVRAGGLVAAQVCKRPCPPCPWRRDNAGRRRYGNLPDYAAGTIPGRDGVGEPVDGDDPAAPFGVLFACHDIPADNPHLCAGHLALYGRDHPLVRYGIALGVIDPAVLEPQPEWPELFDSYEEMLASVGPDAPLPPGTRAVPR
ncbi:DUF6283 family protein [Polymorphospora sp. NPDC050346]|uniref:DUF6283 family protein n=1 Tax=Polymorphospora sp. NPDC050346 TaxID=3155780 RepID=UPI00340AB688